MAPMRERHVVMVITLYFKKNKELEQVRQNKSIWVKQHLQDRQRFGTEKNLLKDLLTGDGNDFKNFM